MNAAVRPIGLLAVSSFAMAFAAPSAIAGSVVPGRLDPAAAIGIQLEQPAATAPRAGTVLQAVVVASDRFSTFGFAGAQVGDRVSVTVLTTGQRWSVQNLRTGALQTVGMVNQKLATLPTTPAIQQPAVAANKLINQTLAAAPTAPAVPIIARASADGADVVVAWWGVRGAVSFEIFRTTDPAQPATRLAQLSNTSLGYRDKRAGAGPFHYQVVAVGANGTRSASAWFPFP